VIILGIIHSVKIRTLEIGMKMYLAKMFMVIARTGIKTASLNLTQEILKRVSSTRCKISIYSSGDQIKAVFTGRVNDESSKNYTFNGDRQYNNYQNESRGNINSQFPDPFSFFTQQGLDNGLEDIESLFDNIDRMYMSGIMNPHVNHFFNFNLPDQQDHYTNFNTSFQQLVPNFNNGFQQPIPNNNIHNQTEIKYRDDKIYDV
jgi:hypothetical protein